MPRVDTHGLSLDTRRVTPRPLTPAQKLKTASALWHSARALKMAMLRAAHPEWDEARVKAEVRRLFLYAR